MNRNASQHDCPLDNQLKGTTLRGALLTLTSPSRQARDMLERLGVATADAAGNVRPLAAIIGDLERALAGMGSAERLEALGTIFPTRQAAGMAELISQGGAQLRAYTEALRDSGGPDGAGARGIPGAAGQGHARLLAIPVQRTTA